ncbi:MAG: peptide deformylase [Candidatus Moranbacteria bacterium]|jgi:peptide deformylase|nr:peptide deformylase [Candidatus Moranbacteria bacterium]
MDYKIVKYPDPILRQKSELIKDPTQPEVQQLILDMLKIMRANEGLGLAAPQIGKNIQLCVIEIEHEVFVLINPQIKKLSGDNVVSEEGCLSFPGKFLPIERADRVKVSAIDANGKKQIIRARGLLARAIQHEVDHLYGILFVDRVASLD